MPYTYTYDGYYTAPSGRRKKRWVIKSPHGRTIAEPIGEGTAKLIVEALNQYDRTIDSFLKPFLNVKNR